MSPILAVLNDLLKQRNDEIVAWMDQYRAGRPPLFYSSVDLRHSGHKLAPVDTNVFPAGFNHLHEAARGRAVQAMQQYFATYVPHCERVALFIESHTRNQLYLDNVNVLLGLLISAGKEVRVMTAEVGGTFPEHLETASGETLQLTVLEAKQGQLITRDGWKADIVILNNDLSTGIPAVLAQAEIPVVPSMQLGWYVRRKSVHFSQYDQILRAFGETFDVDPFLLSTLHHHCGAVHFKEREGLECVALGVERVMHNLREKYAAYGIKDEPYVFVKADNGTYGMGIMTVRSGEEVIAMNKKLRNKMDVIKGGVVTTEVIIQEGIQTIDRVDGNAAEPMLYLVGGIPVACIYRVNAERDAYTSLNAQGMRFEKNVCEELSGKAGCKYQTFGLVAQLASLAVLSEQYS